MTPPLQPLRLRTIGRWMEDNQPETFAQLNGDGALASTVSSLDETMMQAFSDREDALMQQMMKAGTWGTADGMGTFPADRMTLWSEVVSEFLPG